MPMDAPARHRLLLSLRSESVMGLRSVRGQRVDGTQVLSREAEARDETDVGPQEPLRSASVVEPHVGLFAHQQGKTVAPGVSSNGIPSAGMPSAGKVLSGIGSIDLPLLSTKQKTIALTSLNENEVSGCTKCRLSQTRTHTVFGEGDVDAKIFFIGEGPGETEDETGRPFVGRAGQLLDKMIGAMGLSRQQVFIANIVKCRPPNNRVPAPDEVETCTPYLNRQLEMIRPKVIVTLGLPAVKYMLGDAKLTMGKTRGQWQQWRGIKLMPTYHPSYVLRAYTEANRLAVWSDLQLVMKEIGMPPTKVKAKS
jgi:uracil-DNA glycosylase family 4